MLLVYCLHTIEHYWCIVCTLLTYPGREKVVFCLHLKTISSLGMSLSDVRLRFLQLKHINLELSLLLPAVDLRSTHALSLGPLLSKMAHLLFYDVKISFLHAVLNASTRRSLDQAPPEVKMDPLESMTG